MREQPLSCCCLDLPVLSPGTYCCARWRRLPPCHPNPTPCSYTCECWVGYEDVSHGHGIAPGRQCRERRENPLDLLKHKRDPALSDITGAYCTNFSGEPLYALRCAGPDLRALDRRSCHG